MIIIGVTGSFGSGKTFVASIFRSLGATVIDADKAAHKSLKKGSPEYREIVRTFGPEVLGKGRKIDRKKLAKAVFGKKARVKKLNRIVHPAVIGAIKAKALLAKKDGVIVIDAPLLFEANLDGFVDYIVVVKSSLLNQLKRCEEKFCMDKEDVMRRVDAQMSLKQKIKLADFVVDNDGAKSSTKKQVNVIWRKIWK